MKNSEQRSPSIAPVIARILALSPSSPPSPIAEEEVSLHVEQAWHRVKVEALSLPVDAVVSPRVNVRVAALLGMRVAQRVLTSPEHTRFEALAQVKEFELAHLTRMPDFAGALLYVRARIDGSPAASEATVPADLIKEATDVRARMFKVLGFYFDGGGEVARTLTRLRQGSGHADLASDLVALAPLYREHRARIEKTPEFYRATDEADAARLGGQIFQHLATPHDKPTWSQTQQRVWTLFDRAYTELCAAGQYLFRHDPDVDARFPSLYLLNVAARQSPSAEPAAPVAPAAEPAKPGPA